MLKDEVRTLAYRDAIMRNKHVFEGKIVLDVGCGTGILSMFAAKAGAKHVYAVDCSSIINHARNIVKDNGFEDKITLIQGKIEEIDLPTDKVDIIISEWMGYFLLYESMLDSVLFARDKWLVEGGLILPDKATLLITTIEDGEYKESKHGFWDNVYGFDMSAIGKLAMREPLVDTVNGEAVNTKPQVVYSIDILTVKKEDLSFEVPFSLRSVCNDYIHAFVVYFDIEFSHGLHKPVTFSTGPQAPYTHWKQSVLYIEDMLTIRRGEVVEGKLSCKPNARNPRDLDIVLSYEFDGAISQSKGTIEYHMC
ncbi:protein arginine N-methyltransferase 1 [Fonticula alba]|uniref:type I protein arginine methyltransferase n=1 Tax=Fonticula alba TaxID=691883 RepID=A0A058ZFZ3_FONAL|nr:protein arginine N-methyltransferase 1 [Fonticula alba]KCV73279.1 protein arginine N-methyltransferase 1 [Fonticula alba]|eukprot:XP_009492980.1 protein arginine N-methyltransferase 1 [Fonticula alba]